MELSGKVKWFDVKKGYGFLEASDGAGDVFVHYGDVAAEGRAELEPGETVRYEATETPYGRRALRVRKVGDAPAGS